MPHHAGYTITMRPDLGEPTRTVTFGEAVDWHLDDDRNLIVKFRDGNRAAIAAGQWASIEPVQAPEPKAADSAAHRPLRWTNANTITFNAGDVEWRVA